LRKTKEGEANIEVANVRVPRYLIYYKVKKQEESWEWWHGVLPNEMEASRLSAQSRNTKSLPYVETERK